MSRVDDYKYHVIQFLEETYNGTPDYVCVPRTWVQLNDEDDDDPIVNVWYPDEDHKYTERRVRKRKKKSSQWKSFLSMVKFSTDSYEDAKSYVLNMINQEKKQGDSDENTDKCSQHGIKKLENPKEDRTKLSEKAEEKSAKIDNDDPIMYMLETMGWCVSSNSTNDLTLKRKAPQEPEKATPNKRSRESEPDESSDVIAESSSQEYNFHKENHLSHTHKVSDEDLGTGTDKSNAGHSSANRQIVEQDLSKANQSWDPEIFAKLTQSGIIAKLFRLILELEKVMGNEMLKHLLHQFLSNDESHCSLNNYSIASAPRDITSVVPKSNKQKMNEEQPKDKDIDYDPTKSENFPDNNEYDSEKENNNDNDYEYDESDDDDADEPLPKKSNPKRAKKVVLPPDYDANDSRWTLKYREPKRGLVELEKDTGVYISAVKLTHYQEFMRDGSEFARKLLTEIFTTSALSTCSWTGTKAKAYDRDGTNIRPGLDRVARTVLLKYASDYAKMKGWPNRDTQTILISLRNKLQKMRSKTRVKYYN